MSTQSERNQFRRLIGDFGENQVNDIIIEGFLDDATEEVTSDFVNAEFISAPLSDFDLLFKQYHPEVIYLAAINWWWDYAAKLTDRHSKTIGQSTQNVSEKWDRAMQMIDKLRTVYGDIQTLGTDISIGNLSRFSKSTLTRIGGAREESRLEG